MPRVAVDHCYRNFLMALRRSLDLVNRARDFGTLTDEDAFTKIGRRDLEAIAGVALVRIQSAWEEFLECSFARYLCGAHSESGFQPLLQRAQFASLASAYKDVIPPGRQYIDWNPGDTMNRAARYFVDGEPFTTGVGAVRQTLSDMASIRNRFVHNSTYAANRFRAVVQTSFGFIPRGMTPGRLLLADNPAIAPARQSFLAFYANRLIGAARYITP